jgi:cell division protein ZapE
VTEQQPPNLQASYRASLARHGYRSDPAQQRAVARLDDLRSRLDRAGRSPPGLLASLARRVTGARAVSAERGLYLWGDVGRGKTFLMDLFHASLAVPARREHFHRFMKDLHARLKGLRDTQDPLARVALDLARDARVLCLDELFVSDIADAMLLAGLFAGLLDNGVTLVFTSNAPPQELYRDGLQRSRFLPAIALIERHTEVVNVDAGQDYRLRALEKAPLYLDARDPLVAGAMAERFVSIAGETGDIGGEIEIEGRPIPVRARTSDVIWFDFTALCDGPRSQADYVEIARDFHTVLVSDVPRFDVRLENPARRFIALVDEFYDRGVKLVLSAAAPLTDLYRGDRLTFEFDRTRSRLAEMQAHEYLARPHRRLAGHGQHRGLPRYRPRTFPAVSTLGPRQRPEFGHRSRL